MSERPSGTGNHGLESLIGTDPAIEMRPAREPSADQGRLREILRRALHDERLRWFRRTVAVLGVVVLLSGMTLGLLRLLPRPTPDYLEDDMDDVLDYTLLSEEFNKLPVERRLELIKDLVQRMKTLSADDSAVMAAFAATIREEMRRQVERNVKHLAADMLGVYAAEYVSVPPERQDEYLDQTIIGFTKMMEDIAGQPSGLPESDSERLSEIKSQAKRDEERMREDTSRLTAERAARFFEFIHRDEDRISDPIQRGHGVRFMRDMTRHLRGQDIATGKPARLGPG